jgi:hypothetical protein
MKHLMKFERFMADTQTKPDVKPDVRPSVPKPSPIRRDRPSVSPRPKAKMKLKTATVDEVFNRYQKLTNRNEK